MSLCGPRAVVHAVSSLAGLSLITEKQPLYTREHGGSGATVKDALSN